MKTIPVCEPLVRGDQINKKLRVWLVSHDLTVADIAKRIGVTRQYLHYVLHNRSPGMAVRRRIAAEFGCPEKLLRYKPRHPEKKAV